MLIEYAKTEFNRFIRFNYVFQASQIRNKPIKNVDPNAQRFIEMQSEITVKDCTKYFTKLSFEYFIAFTRRTSTATNDCFR